VDPLGFEPRSFSLQGSCSSVGAMSPEHGVVNGRAQQVSRALPPGRARPAYRWKGSNLRRAVCGTAALPLSYIGGAVVRATRAPSRPRSPGGSRTHKLPGLSRAHMPVLVRSYGRVQLWRREGGTRTHVLLIPNQVAYHWPTSRHVDLAVLCSLCCGALFQSIRAVNAFNPVLAGGAGAVWMWSSAVRFQGNAGGQPVNP
jgi:hypothetical protein